ncbi:Protein of unknown function [Jatrophihabitans endophyticus]|uniref:DinB-like domain-containing protein n=1 Tax=Jatrophihabitans endophyticus TaxID=1206085 RepID=A0A1M5DYZ7_9ACTN|nr:DUF664 domain-containing protein [Jatrophihabitans endophyticus]SHF72094.1 Protein of unknown function [Jatrophihabitans endophyticus]
MTTATDLLLDGFGRVNENVHAVLDGADEGVLTTRLDADANTIGWLVWHLLRVQDDHVAGVAGTEQVWTARGWHERFGLPFGAEATGYGSSSDDVAAVRGVSVADYLGYADDVHAATRTYVQGLADEDLARVVDENWDPPVTLAVRLVSVVDDDLEHVGQAAFVRGVLDRR